MDKTTFMSALRACFTESEVDRLSAKAIRSGLDEDWGMSAADRRLLALSPDNAGDEGDGYVYHHGGLYPRSGGSFAHRY